MHNIVALGASDMPCDVSSAFYTILFNNLLVILQECNHYSVLVLSCFRDT